MTVPSTTAISGPYLGDGIQTEFPFSFKIFSANDLQVTINNGTTSSAISSGLYTVDIDPSGIGGIVTLATALTEDYKLSITRNVVFEQTTNLEDGQAFLADTLEGMSDKLTFQTQYLNQLIKQYFILDPTVEQVSELYVLLNSSSAAAIAAAAAAAESESNAAESESNAADSADEAAASAAIAESVSISTKEYGLYIDYNSANEIDFDAGSRIDSTRSVVIRNLSKITKLTDTPFSEGNNQGGIPIGMVEKSTETGTFTTSGTAVTGIGSSFLTEIAVGDLLYSSSNDEYREVESITNDTNLVLSSSFTSNVLIAENVEIKIMFLHAFALYKTSTEDVDAGFDTDEKATALLNSSGYDKYVYRGSVLLDSSGNVIAFFRVGNRFYYNSRRLDFSVTSGYAEYPSGSPARTLVKFPSLPRKIKSRAYFSYNFEKGSDAAAIFTSPYEDDQVPVRSGLADSIADSGSAANVGKMDLITNYNQQLGIRVDNATYSYLKIYILSWEFIEY